MLSKLNSWIVVMLAVTVVSCVVSWPSLSQANPIVYDQFEGYTTGDLNGQSQGSGFSGTWQGGASQGSDELMQVTTSNGLTYPGLATVGGLVQTQAGVSWDDRPLGSTISTGTVYLAGLINPSNTSTWVSFQTLSSGTSGTPPQWQSVVLGLNFGSHNYAMIVRQSQENTVVSDSGISVVANTPAYLMAKIEFNQNGSNDRITFFVNPTPGSEPSTNQGQVATHDIGDIAGLSLYAADAPGAQFDELRIGTSYSDMFGNPVPEPSTIALLGMGVIGLMGWAWRKRKS